MMRDRGQKRRVLSYCLLVVRCFVEKIEYKFTNRNTLLDNNCKGSMTDKRKYDDSYIKFGFTSINDDIVEKGQCHRWAVPRY